MSEKDLREASSIIDVFGLPLVTKAYSKTWSFREDALLSIYKQMHEFPDDATKEDAKFMMRAAIHLIVRGIKDEVFAVSFFFQILIAFSANDLLAISSMSTMSFYGLGLVNLFNTRLSP
jgi:hypothetical protein